MSQRPKPDTRNAGSAYWKAAARGELLVPTCRACDKPFWHPRPHCPTCGSEDVHWKAASGNGTVYTYTIVRRSSDAYFRQRVPYVVAMIELDEGVRLMGNIVGCAPETVAVGLPVEVFFAPVAEDVALPFWRPADVGSIA